MDVFWGIVIGLFVSVEVAYWAFLSINKKKSYDSWFEYVLFNKVMAFFSVALFVSFIFGLSWIINQLIPLIDFKAVFTVLGIAFGIVAYFVFNTVLAKVMNREVVG